MATIIINLICVVFIFMNGISFLCLINARKEVKSIAYAHVKNKKVIKYLNASLDDLLRKSMIFLNAPYALLVLSLVISFIFKNCFVETTILASFALLTMTLSFIWLTYNKSKLKALGKDIIEECNKEKGL